MANPTTRSRTVSAAARAAAKRARRVEDPTRPEPPAPDSWDDPPEPSPEPLEQDPDTLTEPEGSAPPPRPGRRLLTAALGVVLVAALVAAALLGWQYGQGRQ